MPVFRDRNLVAVSGRPRPSQKTQRCSQNTQVFAANIAFVPLWARCDRPEECAPLLSIGCQERTMPPRHHSRLFRFACKALKYFVIATFSCAIAYLISLALNSPLTTTLITQFLSNNFLDGLAIILCLFSLAVLYESFRH